MIAGLYHVLPVRQTATTSGNALWRRVRRISVSGLLITLAWWAVSLGSAADSKKDSAAIRIVPATKSHRAAPLSPIVDQSNRPRTAKPDSAIPPLPADAAPAKHPQPAGQKGAGQLRILPARRGVTVPNAVKYEQIYRSIPYSRSAYEVDPMYRQEIALSLLFNRFPPAPMMPGASGMGGPGGPMSHQRGGPTMGNPMGYGPPMMPPGMMPDF